MSGATRASSSNLNALEVVEAALRDHGKTTTGKAMWQCPAHEDRTPSLSVKRGDKGAIVYCFAGCTMLAIVEALGLNQGDLFDDSLAQPSMNGAPAQPEPQPKIVAEYPFTDRHGEPLSIHRRWEPGKCGKRQKSFTWTDGNPRVLYNLPLVVEAEHVHVNEGGKAADALNKVLPAGHVATYPPVTSEWESSFTDNLVGTTVTVWMDQDETGKTFAAKVYSALTEAGIKASIVQSKTTTAKDDAFDHLEAGFAINEAVPISPEKLSDTGGVAATEAPDDSPRLVQLSTVKIEPIKWLWKGYIPQGKITDVVGDGDLGKSLVMLDIAARVTIGRPMPGEPETKVREPRNVVLLAAEDDLADTVTPRLMAAGADLARVEAFHEDSGITFPDNIDKVERAIRNTNAALFIIDPVMAFLGEGIKSGIDADVRRAIGPLKTIAAKYECAVMILRHANKNERASAANRGGGSVAFRNLSRAALAFGPDRDDPTGQRRHMAQSKKNLTRTAPTLVYRIKSSFGLVDVEGEDGTPVIVWEGIAEGITAANVLGPDPKEAGPPQGTETKAATEYILKRLANGVEVAATVLSDELSEKGFSPKVIRDARSHAGVQFRRARIGQAGKTCSLVSLGERDE